MSESYDDLDYDQDEFEEDEDMFSFGEDDCGRWMNGKLTHSCRLAGTEDCDFECPLRGSL
jgi:hypothetical protein